MHYILAHYILTARRNKAANMAFGSNGTGKNGNGNGAGGLHYALPPAETLPRVRVAMGSIVRGSLQAGVQMKLTGSVEEIRVCGGGRPAARVLCHDHRCLA